LQGEQVGEQGGQQRQDLSPWFLQPAAAGGDAQQQAGPLPCRCSRARPFDE
jgi:hypothetical protein